MHFQGAVAQTLVWGRRRLPRTQSRPGMSGGGIRIKVWHIPGHEMRKPRGFAPVTPRVRQPFTVVFGHEYPEVSEPFYRFVEALLAILLT